jgi:N-acetylmuramoyl-L-alanine amidase
VSTLIERRSPNHDARPEGVPVDILVLHYTGMRTAEEALERLCDPVARVSAHYSIDTDGQVYLHVDEMRRAWHAGVSYWAGRHNVNGRSIGIELVNPGHEFGYVPFAEPQIVALIDLAHGILARHPIPPEHVVGHSDVAPARKMDPGELFPWIRLAEAGIGVFPSVSAPAQPPPIPHHGRPPSRPPSSRASARQETQGSGAGGGEFFRLADARRLGGRVKPGHGEIENAVAELLARFGYGVSPEVDIPLATVVMAFQRHFRPEKVDGVVDDETQKRLETLLESIGDARP